MAAEPSTEEPPARPRWRGRIHQVAFFVSLPLGLVLFAVAKGAGARVAAAVYAVSLAALYGTSAVYHRVNWSPRARAVMRRLDHSMIYVLIAGSYTPICVLVLNGWVRAAMLGTVWAGAAVGILVKVAAFHKLRALGGTLYIVLGWVALMVMPQMFRQMSVLGLGLVVFGGVLYTVGAAMFLRGRPDPSPAVFGYHEVWHSMVTGAGLCHYLAMLQLVATRTA